MVAIRKVEEYLKKEKERVDRYLYSLLPLRNDSLKEFSESLRYAVFPGGKRIRPVLLLHLYRLCGGRGNKALPAAAAIELIHSFSLIQDDLPSMDNDDFRRGKPSLHRAYKEFTALLASDYLLILAFQELARHYPAQILCEATRALGLDGLTGGQYLDLTFQKKRLSSEILKEIRTKKTAVLFQLVFRLAALLAGEDKERVNLFGKYGLTFGLAFQIRDDLKDESNGESRQAMNAEIERLTEELTRLENRMKISSPVLAYFRRFLRSEEAG